MDTVKLMQLAIDKAREGMAHGQSPFGCAIARGDEILAVEHNTVWATVDPTAHAEVNALRAAARSIDAIFLENCVVATTCEPCPMCMSGLHWARVAEVYYGASIADAAAAGFNELPVPAAKIIELGQSDIRLIPGPLAAECQELFREWQTRGSQAY